MASFNTHISAGIVLGVATATFIAAKEILPQSGAFLVATAVTVGAIMPDLDSDTSVPFHIVSSLLALIIGSLTYIYFKNIMPDNGGIILRVIIAVLAVKFVVSPIIKKMTKHRGIWHSIPAAVIITIGSFLSLQVVDLEMRLRFYIAVALGAGYLSHLVLDEGVSLFRFKFLIFWSPKQSLGSALKLAAESKMVTMIAYMIMLMLLIATYPSFKKLL